MSAFILNLDTIAQLSEFINVLNYRGLDFMFSMPQELSNALNIRNNTDDNEKFIFKKLYDLNLKAVNSRYNTNDNVTDLTYPNINPIYKFPNYENIGHGKWIHKIDPWHYQIFKSLRCLIYQCTEDATINDPLYIGLKVLERDLAFYIVSNQVDYIKTLWG